MAGYYEILCSLKARYALGIKLPNKAVPSCVHTEVGMAYLRTV